MNTIGEPVRPSISRVMSIDIFRGLTIAVMIFVNALAEVRGLPWWTYHAPAAVEVMTYVDMVFPFFLFAVGLSLPLAIKQRLKNNSSMPLLWVHVFVRSLGLIVLGFILANAGKGDSSRMGLSGSAWALLALIAAALYLNVYPKSERFPSYALILRLIGLAGVIVLLALFRRTTHSGQVAWLDSSYPEILGLIGYSYFAVALLYIPTRRWTWAPLVWFALLVGLCSLSTARIIQFPQHLPLYFWPFGNGAMPCIVMAGIVTSFIFMGTDHRSGARQILSTGTAFGVLMLAAGYALAPLGISKIRATPTWCLYSIGAGVLLFTALYWICDIKQRTQWAFLIRAGGSNTLLTYLLPDLWYFLTASLGITYLDTHFSFGWQGVAKTLVFTLVMLMAAGALTKAKVRLQL